MRRKLIVCRNPRVHPCAPFVLTGRAKLENLHMPKDGSSNPPALLRSRLRKLLLLEKRIIIRLRPLVGAVQHLWEVMG
jgi:hypothetical protein